jgi:hypothetical protein
MVGEHIREQTNHWYETSLESITQYKKVDLGLEDLEHRRETLLTLSEQYL